jgi:hypothetical protein
VLTLYSLPGFEGKTLTFPRNTVAISLSDYPLRAWTSWNNQAQSVRSIGFFAFSARGTHSARQNTPTLHLLLRAGQVLQLGTCGVAGSSTSQGDTYLRLYDARGEQAAANDDSCGGHSFIRYTVPDAGAYELRAGCFGDTACRGTVAYTFLSP